MNFDEVKLGQRVVLTKDKDPHVRNSRLPTGVKGVVVSRFMRNHHRDFDVVVVLWEKFTNGWPYEPDTSKADCLKEQPTYPGAPKFGEPNAWGVWAECIEPLEEE
jgi:hypothetical protein